MAIYFKVKGQKLSPSSDVFLASKALGYPELVFDFSSDWNGYSKVATFCTSNSELYYMAISNNKCTVPSEVMNDDELVTVGVYGTKGNSRITTNVIDLPCYKSGYGKAYAPTEQTLDLTSQIYNLLTQTTENLLALEQNGYPLASIKSAVADWGEKNAAAFIGSRSLTKDKFAEGAVIDPKPHYQQICSLSLERKYDDYGTKYPQNLQSAFMPDESTVVFIRVDSNDEKAEAVTLNLDTGEYTTTTLQECTAGHANCAILKGNSVFIATGNGESFVEDGDVKIVAGIAEYTYPDFEYVKTYSWSGHNQIWSICYDGDRDRFYFAEYVSASEPYKIRACLKNKSCTKIEI